MKPSTTPDLEARVYLMETRLARAMSRPARMTIAVAVACVAVSVVLRVVALRLGTHPEMEGLQYGTLLLAGGRVTALVEAGDWWRLWSSGWLHGSWLHLGVNTISLWFVGPLLERFYGPARYFGLLMLAVLGGSILGQLGPSEASVGLSGGLAGLVGALLGFVVRYRREVPRSMTRSIGTQAAFMVVLNAMTLAGDTQIDHMAHLGGLLTGFLLGLLLRSDAVEGAAPKADRLWRAAAIGLLGIQIFAMARTAMAVRTCYADEAAFVQCFEPALRPEAPSTDGSGQ